MEIQRRGRERLGTQRHEVGRWRRAWGHWVAAFGLLTLVATLVVAPVTQASATSRAQSAATATLSAQGNFVTNGANGLTTATASLAQAGDLLVIWVKSRFTGNPQTYVNNILGSTGSGSIGTPINAIQYFTLDHASNDDEIWFVPVTSAGTVTLTFNWSGNTSSDFNEYSTQEFQPSVPSVYSLDNANTYENGTSTFTMQFPSLTSAGTGELYAGYNSNDSSGSYSATTAGYTAEDSPDNDAILFGADVSGTQSPNTTATVKDTAQSSIGALIIATATHTVTFDGTTFTGGSSMSPETNTSATALTTNTFTKAGYTFAGWTTAADDSGTSYADGASYPFTTDATLYAQWTADYHTVTFNGNGSTSGLMSPETDNAQTALTTNSLVRTGYTFAGWTTAADDSGTSYADGASYPFTTDATLYAQWTADYHTVTFNGNGSTGGATNTESANTPTALATNTFVKTGYTFSGWNTATNGSGTSYAGGEKYTFTSAITLYAQWTADYFKVTFKGNGLTSGAMKVETHNVPTALSANTFSRTGYTFAYWNTAANGKGTKYANRAGYPFKASVTLYAQWKAVVPHALRIIGSVIVGHSRHVIIVGTGFFKGLHVKSNERGTAVRVLKTGATELSLTVTVGKGSPLGRHTFTIVTASNKTCIINYMTRK